MKHYSDNEIKAKFKKYVRVNFDTNKDAAAHYSTSASYLSQMLKPGCVMMPTSEMLADIGFKKIRSYTRL